MLLPQGVLPGIEQSSWGGRDVGLMWEWFVPFSLWSHLVWGRVGPSLVPPSGACLPHLQPHAQALSNSILCEVQLSSFFEVPSPALTDVQYHFATVIRVSLIFITMHWTSVSDSVCVCVYFLPGPLEDHMMEEVHCSCMADLDVRLNTAVKQGRTASGCSSSSQMYPGKKKKLFIELFGKAWVSVWVCSIWCSNSCAFHFSLLCHLNSSLFCGFFLKKDWYFLRLVKWHRSVCFQDTGFSLV